MSLATTTVSYTKELRAKLAGLELPTRRGPRSHRGSPLERSAASEMRAQVIRPTFSYRELP